MEDYPGLGRFRRTEDKLSEKRFEETLSAYTAYQEGHHISEDKIVYMAKDELEALN